MAGTEREMEKGISLYELQQRVKEAVDGAMKELLWVSGEISEFKQNSNGHCYMELVDYNSDQGVVAARARAVVWSRNAAMLLPYFKTLTGSELAAGMKILVKVQVQYTPLYGLSLNILDIEPTFTVGEAEINRRKVIGRLESEGMFGLNALRPLAALPRKIAVISSATAAGYRDFVRHLSNNECGAAFYIKLFKSPMQGADAPGGIIASLYKIADELEQGEEYDAVAIIRGGGSVLDLASFDDYNLALHIAQFPIPVLTGIGHDHDCHVADLVAYRFLKTPTAVADYIVELYAVQHARIERLALRAVSAAREIVDRRGRELDLFRANLVHAARAILEREKSRLALAEYKIGALNPAALLEKGYAVVADSQGRRIMSAGELPESGQIRLFMKDGIARLQIRVIDITENK